MRDLQKHRQRALVVVGLVAVMALATTASAVGGRPQGGSNNGSRYEDVHYGSYGHQK